MLSNLIQMAQILGAAILVIILAIVAVGLFAVLIIVLQSAVKGIFWRKK